MLLSGLLWQANLKLRLVKVLKRPSAAMSKEDTVSALLLLVTLRLIRVGQSAKMDSGCTRGQA